MIARLKKERDDARELLLKAERQAPAAGTVPAATSLTVTSNGKRGLDTVQHFDFLVTYFCSYEAIMINLLQFSLGF